MKFFRRVQYNSPVVLSFALVSLGALLLNELTGGWTNSRIFSVYRASLLDPLTYARAFLHVLGHSGWNHYINNMLLLLVVGPQLEERYGSRNLLAAIVFTAFITGLAQCIFFPHTSVLGASGIVFMMLLMASMGGMRDGCIPLTLILVALFYIGNEVVTAVSTSDNISQLAHIIGGICGAILGFSMRSRR